MTDHAAPESDDLGVVDPIRAPEAVVAFGRRLRALPPYALGFLLAAIARTVLVVADLTGSSTPDPGAALVGLVLGDLPGSVVLLVPVAVAWSVQANGSASERVIRGSIAVGLSGLAHLAAGFFGRGDGSTVLAYAALSLGANFLLGGGLIWMAHGLEAIRRTEPSSMTRRLGLVVALLGVTVAILSVGIGVVSLSGAMPGPGTDGIDQALFIGNAANLATAVPVLGWAYLAWVLVRGREDPGRPRSGTRAGAVSGWLAGTWFLASAIAILVILPFMLASPGQVGLDPAGRTLYFAVSIGAEAASAGAMLALAWGLASGLGGMSEGVGVPALADEGAPTR